MRRFIFFTLFLGFVLGWVLLRFNPGRTFTEGLVGQPVDLIPGRGPDNPVDRTIEGLLFRSLFVYDSSGEIVPDLVDSHTVSKDGKTYELTLKEAFWRDGRAITSADVVFTFTQDPAFADIRIEQEGERRVRFLLSNPLSSFPSVLTSPVGPAHFRDLPFRLLGSGTFGIQYLKREGGRVTEVGLEREGEGRFRELVFKFFLTDQDLISAASRGEVDSLVLEEEGFADPSFESRVFPIPSQYFAVFFNLSSGSKLAKDRDFRSAAAAAVPAAAGSPVRGPFSGTWAQKEVKTPAPAKKKFSGTLTVSVPSEGDLIEAAQAVKDSWEKLGIEVQIERVPPEELAHTVADRHFDAIILGQKVARDPDRYNLWHSSQKEFPGQNITGYTNARADRALEEGRRVSGRSPRGVHYANFQTLFAEDNPAVFLYHPNFNWYISRKFTGPDPEGLFDPSQRFWNFSDWDYNFEPKTLRGGL